jgi:hypothetical protein
MKFASHDTSFTAVNICAMLAAICFAHLPLIAHAQGFRFLEVKVVDPDGKPMADVPVEISLAGTTFPMPTDEKGIVSINVPAGEESELRLKVHHDGYAGIEAHWTKGNKLPEQFTIPLQKGTAIGGVVHDEDGRPVKGVKIEGIATSFDDYDINAGKGELRPSVPREIGVTDSEGRWQFGAAPVENIELQLRFNHSDYVSDSGFSYRGGTWEELKTQKNTVVMNKGITIAGRVVDGDEQSIVGAQIAIGGRYDSQRFVTKTDADGDFEIPKVGEGSITLTATAAGFAPEMRIASVSKGMNPVRIGLTPGNTVRVRVVDKDGAPIDGVRINPNEWRGTQNLEDSNGLTNDEGRWQWSDAPGDEIKYIVAKQGYFNVNETFAPGEEERTITLLPEVVVNGTIIDKETRKPIESFRYVEGAWWEPTYDTYVLQSHRVQAGKHGKFRFPMSSACVKFCIRVDADGYRPMVSREIFPNEGEISLDFELEAGSGPSGVVLTPAGEPAVGAQLAMATPNQAVYIRESRIPRNEALPTAITDAEGRFSLPTPDGKCKIVAIHDAGWAEFVHNDENEPLRIELIPWSQISGVSLHGHEAVEGDEISLFMESQSIPNEPYVTWSYRTETNSEGEFEFPRIKSGALNIQRRLPYGDSGRGYAMSAASHSIALESRPGEKHQVQIGGEGRKIIGKLTVAEEDRALVDWNMAAVHLTRSNRADNNQNLLFALGKKLAEASTGTMTEPQATDPSVPQNYASVVAPDGSFEIVDVLPGSYDLRAGIHAVDPTANNWNEIALLKTTCVVSDEPDDEPQDLGTLSVPLVTPSE